MMLQWLDPLLCSDDALAGLLRQLPLLRGLNLDRCGLAGDQCLAAIGKHVRPPSWGIRGGCAFVHCALMYSHMHVWALQHSHCRPAYG